MIQCPFCRKFSERAAWLFSALGWGNCPACRHLVFKEDTLKASEFWALSR